MMGSINTAFMLNLPILPFVNVVMTFTTLILVSVDNEDSQEHNNDNSPDSDDIC